VRRRSPEPSTIVLFGASGDLTRRKLVPALYHLAASGLLPSKMAIVGFARREKSDEEFRREMETGVRDVAYLVHYLRLLRELDLLSS